MSYGLQRRQEAPRRRSVGNTVATLATIMVAGVAAHAQTAQAKTVKPDSKPATTLLANKKLTAAAQAGVNKLAGRILGLTNSRSPSISYSHYNDGNNLASINVDVQTNDPLENGAGAYSLNIMAPANRKSNALDTSNTESLVLTEGHSSPGDYVSNPYTSVIFSKNSKNGSWNFAAGYGANTAGAQIFASTGSTEVAQGVPLFDATRQTDAFRQAWHMVYSAESATATGVLNPAFPPVPGANSVPLK